MYLLKFSTYRGKLVGLVPIFAPPLYKDKLVRMLLGTRSGDE